MIRCLPLFTAVSLIVADPYDQSQVPIEVDTNDRSLAKIVLIAGKPSSKPLGHEYFAGCALFMDWLKQTPGVHPVMARDGWPQDESIFENAQSVVFYMDGGDKIPFLEPKRWKLVQRLAKQKVGLVFLHQMVDFPDKLAADAMALLGADWQGDKGGRGHWESSFSKFPNHPAANGLKPFKINDGWLYNLHFVPGMKGITPILVTVPPLSSRKNADLLANPNREELIAWTYDRPAGGRSFAFTAADWHPSWAVESVRRTVINGILWTAGIKVPSTGAPVKLEPGSLDRNLDQKQKPKGRPARNPSHRYIQPNELQGIVLDDIQGSIRGSWTGSTATGPMILGRNYLHDANKNKGEASITFQPEIPTAGKYEIIVFAQPHGNRSESVPVTIAVAGKPEQVIRINQKDVSSKARYSLGKFELPAGKGTTVTISNEGTKGVVIVDGIQFVQ
jgi:hypothetical protein